MHKNSGGEGKSQPLDLGFLAAREPRPELSSPELSPETSRITGGRGRRGCGEARRRRFGRGAARLASAARGGRRRGLVRRGGGGPGSRRWQAAAPDGRRTAAGARSPAGGGGGKAGPGGRPRARAGRRRWERGGDTWCLPVGYGCRWTLSGTGRTRPVWRIWSSKVGET